jgi:hypothetical protein
MFQPNHPAITVGTKRRSGTGSPSNQKPPQNQGAPLRPDARQGASSGKLPRKPAPQKVSGSDPGSGSSKKRAAGNSDGQGSSQRGPVQPSPSNTVQAVAEPNPQLAEVRSKLEEFRMGMAPEALETDPAYVEYAGLLDRLRVLKVTEARGRLRKETESAIGEYMSKISGERDALRELHGQGLVAEPPADMVLDNLGPDGHKCVQKVLERAVLFMFVCEQLSSRYAGVECTTVNYSEPQDYLRVGVRVRLPWLVARCDGLSADTRHNYDLARQVRAFSPDDMVAFIKQPESVLVGMLGCSETMAREREFVSWLLEVGDVRAERMRSVEAKYPSVHMQYSLSHQMNRPTEPDVVKHQGFWTRLGKTAYAIASNSVNTAFEATDVALHLPRRAFVSGMDYLARVDTREYFPDYGHPLVQAMNEQVHRWQNGMLAISNQVESHWVFEGLKLVHLTSLPNLAMRVIKGWTEERVLQSIKDNGGRVALGERVVEMQGLSHILEGITFGQCPMEELDTVLNTLTTQVEMKHRLHYSSMISRYAPEVVADTRMIGAIWAHDQLLSHRNARLGFRVRAAVGPVRVTPQ